MNSSKIEMVHGFYILLRSRRIIIAKTM